MLFFFFFCGSNVQQMWYLNALFFCAVYAEIWPRQGSVCQKKGAFEGFHRSLYRADFDLAVGMKKRAETSKHTTLNLKNLKKKFIKCMICVDYFKIWRHKVGRLEQNPNKKHPHRSVAGCGSRNFFPWPTVAHTNFFRGPPTLWATLPESLGCITEKSLLKVV